MPTQRPTHSQSRPGGAPQGTGPERRTNLPYRQDLTGTHPDGQSYHSASSHPELEGFRSATNTAHNSQQAGHGMSEQVRMHLSPPPTASPTSSPVSTTSAGRERAYNSPGTVLPSTMGSGHATALAVDFRRAPNATNPATPSPTVSGIASGSDTSSVSVSSTTVQVHVGKTGGHGLVGGSGNNTGGSGIGIAGGGSGGIGRSHPPQSHPYSQPHAPTQSHPHSPTTPYSTTNSSSNSNHNLNPVQYLPPNEHRLSGASWYMNPPSSSSRVSNVSSGPGTTNSNQSLSGGSSALGSPHPTTRGPYKQYAVNSPSMGAAAITGSNFVGSGAHCDPAASYPPSRVASYPSPSSVPAHPSTYPPNPNPTLLALSPPLPHPTPSWRPPTTSVPVSAHPYQSANSQPHLLATASYSTAQPPMSYQQANLPQSKHRPLHYEGYPSGPSAAGEHSLAAYGTHRTVGTGGASPPAQPPKPILPSSGSSSSNSRDMVEPGPESSQTSSLHPPPLQQQGKTLTAGDPATDAAQQSSRRSRHRRRKILPPPPDAIYRTELLGLCDFVPFPAAEAIPDFALPDPSRGGSTGGHSSNAEEDDEVAGEVNLPEDAGGQNQSQGYQGQSDYHYSVFLGQVGFDLSPKVVAWVLHSFTSSRVIPRLVFRRAWSCYIAVLSSDAEVEEALQISDRILFDRAGVWAPNSPEQDQILSEYCNKCQSGASRVKGVRLPKHRMVVRQA
jgi:hypothetical protein